MVAGLIASVSYRDHRRRERWTKAADEFRAAFLPAITALETSLGNHRSILAQECGKHEQAAVAFRQYLGRRVGAFNEAWKAYEHYEEEQTNVGILGMIGTEVLDLSRAHDPKHIAEVAEMRKKECLGYINAVLEFAQPE